MSSHLAFEVRKATEKDFIDIEQLVTEAGIHTGGLDWLRFIVAVTEADQLIGCGQLKPHANRVTELASIVVTTAWRGKGVARSLIVALLADHKGPVYLMCESKLGPFYTKFGFAELNQAEIPTYFRRVRKLPAVVERLNSAGERLLVMRRA